MAAPIQQNVSETETNEIVEPDESIYENGKIAIYEEPSCKRCATVLDLILSHQQRKFVKKLEQEIDSIEASSEEETDTDEWETEEESSTDDDTSDDSLTEDSSREEESNTTSDASTDPSTDQSAEESSDHTSSDTSVESSKHSRRIRRRHREHDVPPMITFCFVLLMTLYMVRLITMLYEPPTYYAFRPYYS